MAWHRAFDLARTALSVGVGAVLALFLVNTIEVRPVRVVTPPAQSGSTRPLQAESGGTGPFSELQSKGCPVPLLAVSSWQDAPLECTDDPPELQMCTEPALAPAELICGV